MRRLGVDAVVAEGFEAGGHNGREETTTFCLIPAVREATTLPFDSRRRCRYRRRNTGCYGVGSRGVQIGTRFALTEESSASPVFKDYCLSLGEGDTKVVVEKAGSDTFGKECFPRSGGEG